MSSSTKSLVAKLMAEKNKSVEKKQEDVITIKPYSSATQDLISRLKGQEAGPKELI